MRMNMAAESYCDEKGKPVFGVFPCPYCRNGYGYKDKDGACTCRSVPKKYCPKNNGD
jgi:hypothetical protein